MKVILLRDVAKIGRRYEIVDVPDGFALNKLIPRKDAEPATPISVKRVENLRLRDKSNKEGVAVAIKKMVADLSDDLLKIPMQANEQGHLFQAVHASDVVAAALARGIRIPKEYVSIPSPIKSTGDHKISLVGKGEEGILMITVIAK